MSVFVVFCVFILVLAERHELRKAVIQRYKYMYMYTHLHLFSTTAKKMEKIKREKNEEKFINSPWFVLINMCRINIFVYTNEQNCVGLASFSVQMFINN